MTRRSGHGHQCTSRALSGAAAAAVGVALALATALPVGAATAPTDGASGAATTATAGCGKTPTLRSGSYTLNSGGTNRSYILRVPNNYDNNHPYRLVLGLHWRDGKNTDVANGGWIDPYYGLQARANESAIFVAPAGLDNGWANPNERDTIFIDNLLKTIEADLCVDTSLRFSLGWSWGGGMSYALACSRPTMFRAVAIYSGGVISGCNGGTSPVAMLLAHGMSDNVLNISGARGMRDRFVQNNGCTRANPPETYTGSNTHTSYAYTGCKAGYPVEWYTYDDGHTPLPRDGRTWLPDATWKFFSQFTSTGSTTQPMTTQPVTTQPMTTQAPATTPAVGPSLPGFVPPTYTLPVSRVSADL